MVPVPGVGHIVPRGRGTPVETEQRYNDESGENSTRVNNDVKIYEDLSRSVNHLDLAAQLEKKQMLQQYEKVMLSSFRSNSADECVVSISQTKSGNG
eukprot:Skav211270  [mRNA]  locus=scaffold2429:17694:17984:- [translate_table: standard]